MKPTDPPALATALLERLIPLRTSAGLIGDLIEEHNNGRTRTWYWQQTLIALTLAALHQARGHKFQATSAIVVGYLCAMPLFYVSTLAVGKWVGPYTVAGAYLLFLPLGFLCAAFSGWTVSRSHERVMVVVWAAFCIVASAVAFAVYLLFPMERMSLPMTAVILAQDFVLGPLGVLAGGLLGARVESNGGAPSGLGA